MVLVADLKTSDILQLIAVKGQRVNCLYLSIFSFASFFFFKTFPESFLSISDLVKPIPAGFPFVVIYLSLCSNVDQY